MAYQINDYGASEKAAGLLIPNIPATIITSKLQEDVDLEGGFPVYARKGQDKKCYKTYVSSAKAKAAVFELTPTLVTAAAGVIKVIRNNVEVASVTTTSSSTVKSVCNAITSAMAEDALYTVTDNNVKVTCTAKTAGADRNADVWSIDVGDSGFTFAEVTAPSTQGADAVVGSVFLGFVKRDLTKDSYKAGDVVNVVIRGGIQLKADEDVPSFSEIFLGTASNTILATEGTNLDAKTQSLTSAASGGLFDAIVG